MSVVVPCYGRGDMLNECLQSVVGQEFEDWEMIVVDDGTPTAEVRSAVEAVRDDGIRYVSHPRNLGLSAARNTGFRSARADMVLSLDSDDMLEASFLQMTHAALAEDPTLDCVFTDFRIFGDSDRIRALHDQDPWDLLLVSWIPGSGTLQRKRDLGRGRRLLRAPRVRRGLGLLDRCIRTRAYGRAHPGAPLSIP